MAKRETKGENKAKTREPKEITFRCQSCDRHKPISEMRVINRFFPPMVVCRECEKEVR